MQMNIRRVDAALGDPGATRTAATGVRYVEKGIGIEPGLCEIRPMKLMPAKRCAGGPEDAVCAGFRFNVAEAS